MYVHTYHREASGVSMSTSLYGGYKLMICN